MPELLFILFACVFVAVQLSERKSLRISFAILTLLGITVGGIGLSVSKSYGRTYIALAVDDLAKKAPPEQRDQLIEASNDFKRDFRNESVFSMGASSQLWSAIKQVNYSKSKEIEHAVEDKSN